MLAVIKCQKLPVKQEGEGMIFYLLETAFMIINLLSAKRHQCYKTYYGCNVPYLSLSTQDWGTFSETRLGKAFQGQTS
jgi:hypothetical protein